MRLDDARKIMELKTLMDVDKACEKFVRTYLNWTRWFPTYGGAPIRERDAARSLQSTIYTRLIELCSRRSLSVQLEPRGRLLNGVCSWTIACTHDLAQRAPKFR